MLHYGFKNIIPILDNKEEFNLFDDEVELDTPCNLGIRIAAEEQPDSQFYTSRLGIRMEDIIDYYNNKIVPNPNFRRSEEHTSELQSLMRISYAVFCLKKKQKK